MKNLDTFFFCGSSDGMTLCIFFYFASDLGIGIYMVNNTHHTYMTISH